MDNKNQKAKKGLLRRLGKAVLILILSIVGVLVAAAAALGIYLNVGLHTELKDVRGVNLGSWLVLEHWMTPEVFEEGNGGYDEYTLARYMAHDDYAWVIDGHRNTFITEQDFKDMAAMGVNTVRIPIPYYIFGDRTDEPYTACIDALDNAFDWAEANGIQILIDVHMVPGSANGFDNGGTSGVCTWHLQPDEVEYVLELLERLALRYGEREGLFGIQPVNEPMVSDADWMDMNIPYTYRPVDQELLDMSEPITWEFLEKFYLEVYERIHPLLPEGKWLVYHDAFTMWHWFGFFDGYEGVAWDTHVYLFNMESVGFRGPFWHTIFAWGNSALMRILEKDAPMIVGEWNIYSHYAVDDIHDTAERAEYYKYCAQMQLDLWERCGAGHMYWSYKLGTGAEAEWNDAWELRKVVEYGYLSLNPDDN